MDVLPNEVVLTIAEYTSSGDFVALRATCRQLDGLLARRQWSHVNVYGSRIEAKRRSSVPGMVSWMDKKSGMALYCSNEDSERMIKRYSQFVQSVVVWNLHDSYYELFGLWLTRYLHSPDVAIVGLLDDALIDFLNIVGPMSRGISLDVDLTLDRCPLDLEIAAQNIFRLSVTTSLPFVDWAPCLLKGIDPTALEILDFSCTAVRADELQHAFHRFTRLKSLRLTSIVKNDDGVAWIPSTVRTLSMHPTHHQMRGPVAAENGANVKNLTINQALHAGFGEPSGLYRGYKFSSIIRLTVRDTTPETVKLLQTVTCLQSLDFQDNDHVDVNKVLRNNAHSLKSLVIRNTTPSTNFNCLQQLNFLLVDTLIPPPPPSTTAYIMNKPPTLLHHPSLYLVCTCATSIIDNEGHSHVTHPQGTRLYQILNPTSP
ncbi:hypothetical protein TRICI_000926 [Trichomonascus ciferrii]|uniref:F-box domain-containing protein n=1 Tax=Trichomonascus ciferrii TaxID=44093 RepID=A0A642VB66_9ASCO|nr:hypothetical protein TRICI_000926 [Trichomonascus ciferrii]